MEIKSRVTRLAGLLCVASALQGFPVIGSTNPGRNHKRNPAGNVSSDRHDCGWIRRTRYRSQYSGKGND